MEKLSFAQRRILVFGEEHPTFAAIAAVSMNGEETMTETDLLFAIFGVLSLAAAAGAVIWAGHVHRRGNPRTQVLPPFLICTAGVFIAVLLIFLPVYYAFYSFGDQYSYIRPLLLAIHDAIAVFFVNNDFDIIRDAAAGCPSALRIPYSLYAAILYVVAPVMTFGTVLSLLKDFTGRIRFVWHRIRPFYIMSELNERSVALAKDIAKLYRREKPVIVFANVADSDEYNYDLILEARSMNAICLKKGITFLNYCRKKGKVELFLIGEDETGNVSQAVEIVRAFKSIGQENAANRKVFVFARSASSEYILNSLDYRDGNACDLFAYANEQDYDETAFKLRRVNDIRQLVWNEVPNLRLHESARERTISVLLIGMGEYGFEFFKAILWYCQAEGWRLEVNVIDREADPEAKVRRLCPGLMDLNPCETDGLAHYDIRFFSGVDVDTDALRQMIEYNGQDAEKISTAERLRRTTTAIVALGDDDRNIEASVYLRQTFDRVHHVDGASAQVISAQDERPQIYSIVYNEKKADILQGDGAGHLTDHKKIPYHINFFGSISDQYAYKNVYPAEKEREAFLQHMGWKEADSRLSPASDRVIEGIGQFERFEYYRLSSVAREMYIRIPEQSGDRRYRPDSSLCRSCSKYRAGDCKNAFGELSEHMRWCVYMLVNGYMNGNSRADRAKLHTDIRRCSELAPEELQKDRPTQPGREKTQESR